MISCGFLGQPYCHFLTSPLSLYLPPDFPFSISLVRLPVPCYSLSSPHYPGNGPGSLSWFLDLWQAVYSHLRTWHEEPP